MKPGRICRLRAVFCCIPILALSFANSASANENAIDLDNGAASEAGPTRLHPIVIEHPTTLGKVTTGLRDAAGRAIGIECATCHAAGDGPALAALAEAPKDFHAGIQMAHGKLPCNACHSPNDRTRLRLASGETLEMGEVIQLCGQCHSSQLRSFQHMAHGGARGYWDRTKGPTIRNSCVTCHAAHAPAYPLVNPAAPPNDRFLTAPHGSPAPHSPPPNPADASKQATAEANSNHE